MTENADYDIEVKLLSITPDSERLLEQAGRLCYGSGHKIGEKADWLHLRITQGHESLIEHASATFYIRASRALTHELVRHRLASYSQRSQRYVREEANGYILPPEILTGSEDIQEEFKHAMATAYASYRRLLDAGLKPEIARYVLPNAWATEIICTWNFREIRHILKLRSGRAAMPEMRAVAARINIIMCQQAPKVFGQLADILPKMDSCAF
ncbi:MAG: FAD-dependent thymidylate synthase [Dehalococcoidia bacterium]|nr:FAD-dependent thymidylate synthase [Dehalococcoidia bacterium]